MAEVFHNIVKNAIFVGVLFVFMQIPVAFCQNSDNDKYLLDILVERGILRETEALKVRKEMTKAPEIAITDIKKFSLYFYFQFRYQMVSQDYVSNFDTGDKVSRGLSLRRQVCAFLTKLDDDTDFVLTLNSAAPNMFDSTNVSRKVDNSFCKGVFTLGYTSSKFNMEDPRGAKIKTPDRSVINTFWGGKDAGSDDNALNRTANQCFAGKHVGIFWQGYMPFDEHFIYHVAITNSKSGWWRDIGKSMKLAYWGTLGYEIKENDFSLKTGVNMGYSENVASAYNTTNGSSQYCDCYGLATYLILQKGAIFVQTEAVVSSTEHGKIQSDSVALYTTDSPRATPFGGFITFGYTFDFGSLGKFEPIFRYSYLNTNGAGVSENNVLYAVQSLNGYYDKIHAFYVGFNWYFYGDNLKLQIGYERLRFFDSPSSNNSKHCDTNFGIAQLQIEF